MRQIAALILALPLACQAGPAAAGHGPPNVLFISVDDLNCDLAGYGHPRVKSPNIDRLISRGIRFDRAYCQYPLCNPSRVSFLTGLRPETTGVYDLRTRPGIALKDTVFLPLLFRNNGYITASVGKIFHRTRDMPSCWDSVDNAGGRHPGEDAALRARYKGGNARGRGVEWTPLDGREELTGDGRVGRDSAAAIENAVKEGKPFFVGAGFRKPHLPWTAPKKYFDLYPPKLIPAPGAVTMSGLPDVAVRTELTGGRTPGDPREAIQAYEACVTFMDAQVGVILRTMDRLDLWKKTVVVFFSDHGFHLGDHNGLWGKLSLYERSARVPLVFVLPDGSNAGRTCSRLVELIDLYPTLAELAGLRAPDTLDGKSLVPLLKDPEAEWDRPAYCCSHHTGLSGVFGRSVRTERFFYAEWNGGKEGVELIDRLNDPGELTNVAFDPKYAAVKARMTGLLHRITPRDPRTSR